MSLPTTYKRAVFKGSGEPLTIEDAELKMPGDNEILVKVEACGVCHSDVFSQYGHIGGGFPITPGHEIIGKIVAVGQDMKKEWQLGDRVGSGWHGGHDGTCTACTQGYYQMCEKELVNGGNKNGGYAEYCILRADAVAHIPDHVDSALFAPVLCAGLTVFNGLRNMEIRPGETVVVQGLGGLGHLAIQYARHMGYRVIAASRGAEKEKAAREFGADHYIDLSKTTNVGNDIKALGGAALVITTGPSETSAPFLDGLLPRGKLLVLSPGDLTISTIVMTKLGLSVHAWPWGHARDCEDAITFTERENIQCTIEKFPLSNAQAAFERMLSGNARFRVVIVME